MKRKILGCLTALAMCLSFATFIFAQNDNRIASAAGDMYVISAKAGGINYVEGKVAVARNNSTNGYAVKGDNLEVGEKISTGANGKAEILLNPGSYVRLGENTIFEFASTSLDDVEVKLTSGSAIFEVYADDEFKVAITTLKANFYAVKSGVYRVDVLSDGSGRISVWKGKAQVGENAEAVVKGGKAAVVVNGQVKVENFDRDDKDSLESWSKDRAKDLAKLNSKLQRNNVRNSLINSFNNNRWGLYDSFGLWVFDRFAGYYCFVPFGYGWSSPYGYWYNRSLWDFRLPVYVYTQPPPMNSNNGSSPTNSERRNSRKIQTSSGESSGRPTFGAPPFERVQRTVDRKVRITNDDALPSVSFPARTAPPVVVPVEVPRSSNKRGQ